MEEFKKPCLPNPTIKLDKDETPLKTSNENKEKCKESANPSKPENPYKVPQWSDKPVAENSYNFEVLKSGQIIDEVKQLQKKAYWSFGRLPENDIVMAHPTISRFHAILQYRPICRKAETASAIKENENNSEQTFDENGPPHGWYIYDMESTHGTFLNKQRIPPKVYIRIRVGHLLRLGASSRSYILQGPPEDEEPESKLTITELKAKRQYELEEAVLEKQRLADEAVDRANNEGCSWGMAEDADEETDLKHNPYASTNNEEFFLDDPKKTLRGYFEREGLELVYKCDEMSAGSFVCRVELPIDDSNGRSILAEVVHKGKKKDCVVQCALEACRILDRHGVLRQANQEPLRRKQKSQDSDSDDEFWDRTGDVARKKQRKAASNNSVTLTYEDLLKQEIDIDEQIRQISSKIKSYQEQQQRVKSEKEREGEDLDAFMENIQDKEIIYDKTEIRKLRIEEQRLKIEKLKVQKLQKIAKPFDIHFGQQAKDKEESQPQEEIVRKKQLPMIGKRNQFSKFKIVKVQSTKETKPSKLLDSDEEEVDEDEKIDKECKVKSIDKEFLLDTNVLSTSITNIFKIDENTEKTKENETTEHQSENDKSEEKQEGLEGLQNSSGSENKSWKEIERNSKKRRHRVRQRDKREEIDMNEVEYESSEKYAKWIPPENQTGDGFTELNKKFGY